MNDKIEMFCRAIYGIVGFSSLFLLCFFITEANLRSLEENTVSPVSLQTNPSVFNTLTVTNGPDRGPSSKRIDTRSSIDSDSRGFKAERTSDGAGSSILLDSRKNLGDPKQKKE